MDNYPNLINLKEIKKKNLNLQVLKNKNDLTSILNSGAILNFRLRVISSRGHFVADYFVVGHFVSEMTFDGF
jgi:hypothetical protein